MLTKDRISARKSVTGQYGFHYPDFDAEEITIPLGSQLEPFIWSPRSGYQAFKWDRESDPIVVWVDLEQVK